MLSFESFPLWGNLLVLAIGAVIVWFSGVRLEASVEVISERTGIGSAFGGIVLLALATSLPEVATTVSGAIIGNPILVSNNLIGGVAMQTAVLALADFTFRRGALTYFAPGFALIMGGVSLVLMLGLLLVFMILRDPFSLLAVGSGTLVLATAHFLLLHRNYIDRDDPGWQPLRMDEDNEPERGDEGNEAEESDDDKPLGRQWLRFGLCSLGILVAGWAVMNAAQAVTKQTGISASFIGATLVAITTSLPEVSTTLSSVRRGDNEMAVANIFGSNMWCVSLLFLGDLCYRKGPLLADTDRQANFMASLGIVMTCIYLWGLLERRDRTIGRLGTDSAMVVALYLGGLVILYLMG